MYESKKALLAIRETMKQTSIGGEAVENAIYMCKLGHRGMVDNLLYSVAKSENLKLPTVDENLLEFVKKHNLAKNTTTPEELT